MRRSRLWQTGFSTCSSTTPFFVKLNPGVFYENRSKSYGVDRQRNMRLVLTEEGRKELHLYRNNWFRLREEVDF